MCEIECDMYFCSAIVYLQRPCVICETILPIDLISYCPPILEITSFNIFCNKCVKSNVMHTFCSAIIYLQHPCVICETILLVYLITLE